MDAPESILGFIRIQELGFRIQAASWSKLL